MRYLLIPSCEVAAQNSLSGTTTEKRLVRGLALWRIGGYDAIIVTGGLYLPPEVQTIPSGTLMRDWLTARGVPFNKIVCEDKSLDTYENISSALALVADDPSSQFMVVTHWQHALRFWVTFRLAHRRKARIVPMFYWVDLKTFLSEWFFLLIHLFDRRGVSYIATRNRKARAARALPKE